MRLPQEFRNDPLYMAVINSKTIGEYNKSVKILLSIRGPNSLNLLTRKLQEENTKQEDK